MLKNQVFIVTGASSGIGQSIAESLAAQGANLVLVARRETLLQQLATNLMNQYDVQVIVKAGDLTQPKFIEEVVTATVLTFGQIDGLINNAGYGIFQEAIENTYDDIVKIFQLNVFAMMYLSQLVAIEMLKKQKGHIFFTASIAGKIATPMSSLYSATKFATIGYADALRLELANDGIHVTTINPGPVKTNFFEVGNDTMRAYYNQVKSLAITPESIAKKVIKAYGHNVREITMPFYLNVAHKVYTLAPKLSDFLALNLFNFKEDFK